MNDSGTTEEKQQSERGIKHDECKELYLSEYITI
jgi:hypothetical protein